MVMHNLLLDTSARVIHELDLSAVERGTLERFWVHIVTDGIGQPVHVPVLVARGVEGDDVLGCTAVIHGNEINGIPVIQRLFQQLDVETLRGTVVGVPIINVPSLLRKKRRFIDGKDLNHIMPGKADGDVSEVYAYRIMNNIIRHFDYLVDLHTASFGRVNSYYIRADMDQRKTAKMAMLQNAQIIVHNPPSDGTLRGAADDLDIPAITLEVGDPNTFQRGMIRSSLTGIHNLLSFLRFTDAEIEEPVEAVVICRHSYWMYTDTGGILRVYPSVTDRVRKGEVVAAIYNIFGDLIKQYMAPEDGIVIGKSVNPICQTGGRILHLGVGEGLLRV